MQSSDNTAKVQEVRGTCTSAEIQNGLTELIRNIQMSEGVGGNRAVEWKKLKGKIVMSDRRATETIV